VIQYTQAGNYVDQVKTVEGTIVYTYVSGSNVFLDFHYPYQGYFYVYIPSTSNFRFSPASFYLNKEVRVTGTIVLYKGTPEIIVNSPSQIEVAYVGFNYP
jgi:micrococcal nuclease